MHDFSENPDLKNGRGQNVEQAGRCGFCHAVHDAIGPMMWVAQKQAPVSGNELCTLCHRENGFDKARPVTRFVHPTGPDAPGDRATIPANLPLFDPQGHVAKMGSVACGSCHDPHAGKQTPPNMLRAGLSPTGLCVQCHTAEAGVAEGPHDSGTDPQAWPKDSQDHALCMACHTSHSDDPARGLWRVAPLAPAPDSDDAVCLGCHPKQNWAPPTGEAKLSQLMHPRLLTGMAEVPSLPLAQPTAEKGQTPRQAPAPAGGAAAPAAALQCRTCHNPHSNRAAWHLLRETRTDQPAGVCYQCHQNAAPLDQSMHAPWVSPMLSSKTQVCGPCHAVHKVEGSKRDFLWAAGQSPLGADQACAPVPVLPRSFGSGGVGFHRDSPGRADVVAPGVQDAQRRTARPDHLRRADQLHYLSPAARSADRDRPRRVGASVRGGPECNQADAPAERCGGDSARPATGSTGRGCTCISTSRSCGRCLSRSCRRPRPRFRLSGVRQRRVRGCLLKTSRGAGVRVNAARERAG